NRLAAFGGIDDQLYLAVLDRIYDVRAPFTNLIHPLHCNACLTQRLGGSGRGNDLEARIHQVLRNFGGARLINISDRHKSRALSGQTLADSQSSLGKGFIEAVSQPHHLTGGFHFRPENWINRRELVEREYRL